METQYLLNRILTIYAGEMSLNALKEISSFDKSYYQDGDDEETGEENDEKRLTLSVFCLTLICAALPARADKEFFQKVEEYLGVVENNKNWVENQLSLAEEMKRSASEGIGNAMQKINEVKANPLSADEELLNVIPSDIPDINNIGKATEQVGKSYNAQMGQGNDNQVSQEQHDKMMDIQRENVANLYAVAFTTRTLLAKERKQDEPSNDMKSTREIIKLTNKKLRKC